MNTRSPLDNPKCWPLAESVRRRDLLRSDGRTLAVTNGCFDLMHAGHLYFLASAARHGDALWVLLNGDASVRDLKGPDHPIQTAEERAYALAALTVVDGVVIFPSLRLADEILAVKPDVYLKAGDYSMETIDPTEKKALHEIGARIEFLPLLEGYSTSTLIERIRG